MQRNWIGLAKARWSISNSTIPAAPRLRPGRRQPSASYTTRVDTIYGRHFGPTRASASHRRRSAASNPDLRAKVDQLIAEQRKAKEAGDIGEIEKHGVATGRYAINPFNGKSSVGWPTTSSWITHRRHHERSRHGRAGLRVREKSTLEIRLVVLPSTTRKKPWPSRLFLFQPPWHVINPVHTAP